MTHSSWPDRLKWAEEQGLKNLQEKFSTADAISKEAQTTLTYVVAGLGSTFAYVFTNLDKPITGLVSAAALLCLYFMILGLVLVVRTFFLRDFPSPYQEPKNLLLEPHRSIDEVREGELDNIDSRIAAMNAANARSSRVINWVRGFLVASPIVGVVAVCLFRVVG